MDSDPALRQVLVKTTGRSSQQILKDTADKLGVSELTAGYLLTTVGVQVES